MTTMDRHLAIELLDETYPDWREDIPADQHDAAIERMMDSGVFARARFGNALWHLMDVAVLAPWRRLRRATGV